MLVHGHNGEEMGQRMVVKQLFLAHLVIWNVTLREKCNNVESVRVRCACSRPQQRIISITPSSIEKQLIRVHLVIRNVVLQNSAHVCELGVVIHAHNARELARSMIVKQFFSAHLVVNITLHEV